MAYKFGAAEPVPDAITRCAREQLERAIADLTEDLDRDPASAVHHARKSIKKQRSLLRLARGAMPSGQRRRENAALRNAAGHLSDARDAEAMVQTLQKLSDRFAGQVPERTFTEIQRHFEAARAEGRGSHDIRGDAARAAAELADVLGRTGGRTLTKAGWKAIDAGLLRSYKHGRRSLAAARQDPQLEKLHALRKRAKDLWYHSRLLAPACGPVVRGQAKDAHALADLLGDDHDLGLLREALAGEGTPAPVDVDAVIRLIDHRRPELQAEAIHIGERLYAEPPKAFRRRMRRSWNAGSAHARAAVNSRPADLAEATRAPLTARPAA